MTKRKISSKKKLTVNDVRRSEILVNEYIANALSTRTELLSRMIEPEGGKDINKECGYPDSISVADFQAMYDREGLGSRVVSMWPEECWVQDPSIQENAETAQTDFELKWQHLEERFNLYHHMHQVDELSGIGQFGVMFIGFNDGLDLSQPVRGIQLTGARTGQRQENFDPESQSNPLAMTFIRTFSQSSVKVEKLEKDIKSPRYNEPVEYTIQFDDAKSHSHPVDGGSGKGVTVHWTRVIHVSEDGLTFSTPRQQKVWNRLLDCRKLLGGSAEMFWKGAFPGYSFETHPDLGDVELDVEGMREEFKSFSEGLTRYMALSGITAKSLSPQVAEPTQHIEIQLQLIGLSMRVPWRQLMGSEQGRLASDSDRKSFDKRIMRRRRKQLTPCLVKRMIDRLIILGILPIPEPPTTETEENCAEQVGGFFYKVVWPEIEQESQLEKANVGKVIVDVISRYLQSDAVQLISEQDLLVRVLGYSKEEADEIIQNAVGLLQLVDPVREANRQFDLAQSALDRQENERDEDDEGGDSTGERGPQDNPDR